MIGAKLSSTFHGRDIFSPAAAHLARGDDWKTAGPEIPVAQLVRLQGTVAKLDEKGLHAEVIGTDGPYGNLVLNVPQSLFAKLGYSRGEAVPFTLNGKAFRMPFVRTFDDVPVGQNLLYIDSRDRLSIAIAIAATPALVRNVAELPSRSQRSPAPRLASKPPIPLTNQKAPKLVARR